VEEYEADLRAAKVKQDQDLKEAAAFLRTRSPEGSKTSSPTFSEEGAYKSAFGKKWSDVARASPKVAGDWKYFPVDPIKVDPATKVVTENKEKCVSPKEGFPPEMPRK
jgi:hypothetical protein